jgi:tetratricopeptide (TPR) repeat protein
MTPNPRGLERDVVLVAAVAALLRVLFWVETHSDPLFSILAIDGRSYVDLATRFASGDWGWGRETLWFAPLYPALLGVIFLVSGPEPDLIRVLQHGLGVGTALLGMRLGARFSPRAGLVAGLLLALSPVLVFYEHQLYYPSVAVFVTALFLVVLLGGGRAFVAGLLLGVLGLARSNALLFLPVGAAWLVHREGKRAGILFVAGGLTALAPVILRNGVLSGAWTPLTVNGGMIFATGFGDEALGGRSLLRRPEDFGPQGAFHREAEQLAGREMTLAEASRFHRERALSWIVDHPGATAELTLRKLALLFHVRETDDNLGFPFVRERARTLSWWPGPWAWFLVGAGAGVFRLGLRPGRVGAEGRLLTLFILTYSASLLMFFVNARYRLPLVVPAAVLAGVAVDEGWRALRSSRARGWVAPLAAAIACLFLALRDPGVRADPALNLVAVGGALQDEGRPAEALAFTERAIEIDPTVAGAHQNRALALRSLGRGDEALGSAKEATRLDPDLAPAWMTLGTLLAEAGRVSEAVPAFRRAAELEPENPGALVNLAQALAATGDLEGAIELGRRAEQLGVTAIAPRLRAWEESVASGER